MKPSFAHPKANVDNWGRNQQFFLQQPKLSTHTLKHSGDDIFRRQKRQNKCQTLSWSNGTSSETSKFMTAAMNDLSFSDSYFNFAIGFNILVQNLREFIHN